VGTAGSIEACLERAVVGPRIHNKTGARAKDATISSVEKPCQQLTLAWPQDSKRFALGDNPHHQHASDELKNRWHGASTGLYSLFSCSSCRAGSLGKAGVSQVCLPIANTVSTANQSFCSSGLSCKKPAAACCLGHFSCGMMIRGGEAELEREWVGVAGGRLRVLVALSTICCLDYHSAVALYGVVVA
jgi:hypothetical protein